MSPGCYSLFNGTFIIFFLQHMCLIMREAERKKKRKITIHTAAFASFFHCADVLLIRILTTDLVLRRSEQRTILGLGADFLT